MDSATKRARKSVFANAETYCFRCIPAAGFSHSSVKAVLRAMAELILETGSPPSPEDVVKLALGYEGARAQGFAVAAQDVVPIVYGGAVTTRTASSGVVWAEAIEVADSWVKDHIVWAYHPRGERHQVPGLLKTLLRNSRAEDYIKRISKLAFHAAASLAANSVEQLATTVAEYRTIFFEEWGAGRLINPRAAALARTLERYFGSELLAWKPPGAGSASSIILITTNAVRILQFLLDAGWHAQRAIPTAAIGYLKRRDVIQVSAGMRLDLVGAADLGINLQLGGACCGLAVEPRSELTIRAERCAKPASLDVR
jgi:hypothetical protein